MRKSELKFESAGQGSAESLNSKVSRNAQSFSAFSFHIIFSSFFSFPLFRDADLAFLRDLPRFGNGDHRFDQHAVKRLG